MLQPFTNSHKLYIILINHLYYCIGDLFFIHLHSKKYIYGGEIYKYWSSHFDGLTCCKYNRNQDLKDEISVSMSNQKAFIAENSSLKEENRVFKFTVEQINYYNDSILQKMNKVRKELKIKDGNNAEVFPAVNVTAVEFDTYLEAKAYVDEHNLVYEEPEYGE